MMKRTEKLRGLAALMLASLIVIPVLPAEATFPGGNGLIVFVSDRDGDSDIYTMDPDGTGVAQLTTNTVDDGSPAFSADGTRITFASTRDGNWEIYTMNADGTGVTRLTTSVFHQDVAASWSPDGSKIVWRRDYYPPEPCTSEADLWIMNADGSSPMPLVCGPGFDGEGVFSPDGTKIAFARCTVFGICNAEIYVRDVGGAQGSETRITFNSAQEGGLDWQSLDATAPTITITTPANGAQYILGSTVHADYSCDDPGGSGVATCAGPVADGAPIDTASVGAKSFTVNATDNAGNPSSSTHTYTVVYDFEGFFSPVDNLPVLNSVKAGSSVPVRFSLNGDQGLSIFAAGYPKSETIACDSTAPVDGVEETVSAGSTGLTYDASLDEYRYVWRTSRPWTGTCRQLVVKLADGNSYRANFKLK